MVRVEGVAVGGGAVVVVAASVASAGADGRRRTATIRQARGPWPCRSRRLGEIGLFGQATEPEQRRLLHRFGGRPGRSAPIRRETSAEPVRPGVAPHTSARCRALVEHAPGDDPRGRSGPAPSVSRTGSAPAQPARHPRAFPGSTGPADPPVPTASTPDGSRSAYAAASSRPGLCPPGRPPLVPTVELGPFGDRRMPEPSACRPAGVVPRPRPSHDLLVAEVRRVVAPPFTSSGRRRAGASGVRKPVGNASGRARPVGGPLWRISAARRRAGPRGAGDGRPDRHRRGAAEVR